MDQAQQALEPQFELQRMICACPKCDQSLELFEDQLDQAEGWVRCVRCEQVFLGLACLVEQEPPQTDAPFKSSFHLSARGQGSTQLGPLGDGAQSLDASKPMSLDEFLYQRTLHTNKPAVSQVQIDPVLQSPLGAKALALARGEVKAHPRKRSWGWVWFAILMVLGLVPLWFTLSFKNEVAALYPGLKPPLVKMCQAFNCEVEWPRDLSALSIESSALEKEELSDKEGRVTAQNSSSSNTQSNTSSSSKRFAYRLSLRLKNSFSYPVALPKVKLTLLDEKDQVLQELSLVISVPQDPQVIRPGGLNPFVMPIDVEDAKIRAPNGYRVELE